jgi:hypothetical protein
MNWRRTPGCSVSIYAATVIGSMSEIVYDNVLYGPIDGVEQGRVKHSVTPLNGAEMPVCADFRFSKRSPSLT